MDLLTAVEVIQAPLGEMLPRLSEALAATIPHRAIAELANCSFAPFKFRGESPGPTTADLDALRPFVPARGNWAAMSGRVG